VRNLENCSQDIGELVRLLVNENFLGGGEQVI